MASKLMGSLPLSKPLECISLSDTVPRALKYTPFLGFQTLSTPNSSTSLITLHQALRVTQDTLESQRSQRAALIPTELAPSD